MKTTIKIGKLEVVDQGTVIGNSGEPITFQIEDLTYEFHFSTNKETPDYKIDIKQNTGKSVVLEFINFNNSLGSGNKKPIKLGDINGQQLFLNFRIYPLTEDAGKMFTYTWFLGEKEGGADGK